MRLPTLALKPIAVALLALLSLETSMAQNGLSDREKAERSQTQEAVDLLDYTRATLDYFQHQNRSCRDCLAATAGDSPESFLDERQRLPLPNESSNCDQINQKLCEIGDPSCDLTKNLACESQSRVNAGSSKGKACRKAWDEFYKEPTVSIQIAFGYIDSDFKKSSDHALYKAALVRQLTQSCLRSKAEDDVCAVDREKSDPALCRSKVRACGFKFGESQNILTKKTIAPDGKEKVVSIELVTPGDGRVAPVSPKTHTSKAITTFDSKELDTSIGEAAEREYLKCLGEKRKTCFYLGHGRGGAGPSFSPALRNEKGLIDYARYRKEKASLKSMVKTLTSSSKPAAIIGVFVCDGQENFGRELHGAAPNAGIIAPVKGQTSATSNLFRIYAAIDSILWARCQESFLNALNSVKSFEFNESPDGGSLAIQPTDFQYFYDSFSEK